MPKHRQEEPSASAIRQRRANRKMRKAVLMEYGGKCTRCGDDNLCHLELHHIGNDGSVMRKEHGSGNGFFYWLRKNGFPNIVEILCANCHAETHCLFTD